MSKSCICSLYFDYYWQMYLYYLNSGTDRQVGFEKEYLRNSGSSRLQWSFSLCILYKNTFSQAGLHPFGRMTTPFRADSYTLLDGWCSPSDKMKKVMQLRFSLQELQFLLIGTVVSLNGNCRFSYWELSFLLMGTLVSVGGNVRFCYEVMCTGFS